MTFEEALKILNCKSTDSIKTAVAHYQKARAKLLPMKDNMWTNRNEELLRLEEALQTFKKHKTVYQPGQKKVERPKRLSKEQREGEVVQPLPPPRKVAEAYKLRAIITTLAIFLIAGLAIYWYLTPPVTGPLDTDPPIIPPIGDTSLPKEIPEEKKFAVKSTIKTGREEQVRSLFENCQNTYAWKESLRKVLANEKIEVIAGGAFRIGTLFQLLEKENVCDFSFNSISSHGEREQLNITHKKRKALAELKCANEKDLFNLSRYVLNKFTMFCTSMSNNNLDLTKRFEAYEAALQLFIDDQRIIGLIRGKGQGEITFNVKDYFKNELLKKRKKYDFVNFRILDSLSQVFVLTNLKIENGKLKGELIFNVEYSAGKYQRRKGDADQEVILYTDVTRKRVEIFIEFYSCFNSVSEFIENHCCMVQLGDIKAEEIETQEI